MSCGDRQTATRGTDPPQPLEGHIRVDPRTLAPGDTLRFRVVNTGETPLAYGRPFQAQRLVGDQWRPANGLILKHNHGWTMEGIFTEPGRVSRPELFPLPRNLPAGSYRLLRRVSNKLQLHRASLVICGDFEID
jgi:hypothetical protein